MELTPPITPTFTTINPPLFTSDCTSLPSISTPVKPNEMTPGTTLSKENNLTTNNSKFLAYSKPVDIPQRLPTNLFHSQHISSSAGHLTTKDLSFHKLSPPLTPPAASCYLPKHSISPIFKSKYDIGQEIGSGATGFVVAGTHISSNTPVTIKFILKDRIPIADWKRDRQIGTVPIEIYMLRRLSHPNIIKYFDFFEDQKFFYLVMEQHGLNQISSTGSGTSVEEHHQHDFAPAAEQADFTSSSPLPFRFITTSAAGNNTEIININDSSLKLIETKIKKTHYQKLRKTSNDLYDFMNMKRNLTEQELKFVFKQVVQTVAYLHGLNVVHKDIKKENILVDDQLIVKIIDFGTAAMIPQDTKSYFTDFHGTLHCAAPEIIRGLPYQGPPQDIWSLGILLYSLAFGRKPFLTVDDALYARLAVSGSTTSTAVSSHSTDHDLLKNTLFLDLLQKIFQLDVDSRISIDGILSHPWLQNTNQK